MKIVSYAPITFLLVGTSLLASEVKAQGYTMPMEMARYFSQSATLHHLTPEQIDQRFTPQIREYFETEVPVYRHCRKQSLVNRDYYGSTSLCSAYNYYYDRLMAQFGNVPFDPYSGPNPGPDAFRGVPPGGSESYCLSNC